MLGNNAGRRLAKSLGSMWGASGDNLQNMLFPTWQTGPRLGAKGMLAAYSTMPWLRAYLQKISEDVSGLSWVIYVPTNSAGVPVRDLRIQRAASHKARVKLMTPYLKAQNLREIPNHPALNLITGGNDWFSGLVSMQLSQTHLDMIGEMAWILEVNAFNMPVEAVPIPPTWIMQLPTTQYPYYRVIAPTATWEVPRDRMFFTYHPNPSNPFLRGSGIGQVLADELETDEYAAKYVKNWFRNNAIPPVLISGLGVGLPELQRLEEKWLAKYQRTGPGWLPHFLGKEVNVHQLSQSFQQQELGELRTLEKNTIRQVIGIPPEIMGDVTSSNRSTIDSADFIYQSRCIVPRAEFLRAAFQQFLIPMFDPRLIIDYINPVAEDREFALKVRQAAPYAWTVDEWRALGLTEPLPNGQGNVHALPFNVVLTGPNMATQAALDRLKPPAPVPTPGIAPAPSPKPALPPASAGEAPPPAPPPPPKRMTPAERADALRDRIARVREDQLHKSLHHDEIAAILTAISPSYFEDHGSVILRSAIEKFGVSTLEEATGGSIDITFNMNDENVTNFLKSWGGDRISMINETTKEKVGATLAEGVEAGETYDELVTRIGAVFDTREDQAENIATTELTRATGFAANEALSQGGFEEKEWLATDDDHVRDTHKDLDGTVVGVDEDFVSSSGASGPYPGELGDPAEDCNCRCQIITVLAERSAMMRAAQWKVLDAERRPFDRRLTSVFTAGLRLQREAVLDALKTAAKALEAA